jgi:hypothetical protein
MIHNYRYGISFTIIIPDHHLYGFIDIPPQILRLLVNPFPYEKYDFCTSSFFLRSLS